VPSRVVKLLLGVRKCHNSVSYSRSGMGQQWLILTADR